jgi:hypothetical protein
MPPPPPRTHPGPGARTAALSEPTHGPTTPGCRPAVRHSAAATTPPYASGRADPAGVDVRVPRPVVQQWCRLVEDVARHRNLAPRLGFQAALPRGFGYSFHFPFCVRVPTMRSRPRSQSTASHPSRARCKRRATRVIADPDPIDRYVYDAAMILDPVTLVGPQVLHRDERHTVWHAGVIQGPNEAIVLNLHIDSPEERRFRDDPAWKGVSPPPIDAFIETPPGHPSVDGSFSFAAGRFAFRFEKRFQPLAPEHLQGSQLHLKVHPLGLSRRARPGPRRTRVVSQPACWTQAHCLLLRGSQEEAVPPSPGGGTSTNPHGARIMRRS